MLRPILRNVQNTLILSSVLLVLMALQRLHQFDSPLANSSGRIEDFQPGEPSKLSVQHQFTLGKDVKFGLFRFIFPKLERGTEPLWHPELDQAMVKKRRKGVVVMVEMESCDDNIVDASIVLKQSIHNIGVSDVKVYGLFPEHCSQLNATFTLADGYWLDHIVFMSTHTIWQTIGLELAHKARLIIRIPVNALVVGVTSHTTQPLPSKEYLTTFHRQVSTEEPALNNIQWLRPSRDLAENITLAEQSTMHCSIYPCIIPTTTMVFDLFNNTSCPSPWKCHRSVSVSDYCNTLINHWLTARQKAFGGLDQSDACDTENNYRPMSKLERSI